MTTFETIVRGLLANGIGARFRAAGDSMDPTIRSGDVVDIEPCDVSLLRRGEIILARTPRGLTLHRIVRISSRGIEMRGDNASCADPLVAVESVLGRASVRGSTGNRGRIRRKSVKIIRLAGRFGRRLRTRLQHSFRR